MLENPNLQSIDFSQSDGEFQYQGQIYQFKYYLEKAFFKIKSYKVCSYIYSINYRFLSKRLDLSNINNLFLEENKQWLQRSNFLIERCIHYQNTIFCFSISQGEYCSLKSQYWIPFEWKPFQQLSLDDILARPNEFFVKQSTTIYLSSNLDIDDEEIHPTLRDAYKFAEEKPLEFVRGSESELRQMTKIFLFSNKLKHLFEEDLLWKVIYESSHKYKIGGFVGMYNGKTSYKKIDLSQEIQRLFDLIFEHNFFTGLRLQMKWCKPGVPRYPGYAYYEFRSHPILVKVQPPSQHERLEAAFELQSWLKGKLPDDEIRAYFEE